MRSIGIAGTLAVHALLIQPFILGASATRSALDASGPGATALEVEDGSYLTLVLVHVGASDETAFMESVASSGLRIEPPVIQITSPDPAPLVVVDDAGEQDTGDAAVTAGDPATQSLLFGRYTGQIDARIQRAWRKPRTPVEEMSVSHEEASASRPKTFRCEIRIRQNKAGYVQEVELVRCNGTPAWQVSLVRAVQSASPLPAPPSPSVFTTTLSMTFEGREFVAGAPVDEYEVENTRTARAQELIRAITPSAQDASADEL